MAKSPITLPASPKLELDLPPLGKLVRDNNGVRLQNVSLIEPGGRDDYRIASGNIDSNSAKLGQIFTQPKK